MSKRICVKCGKEKELKGGKICEKGHFVCKECTYESWGLIFSDTLKKCPVCEKPLK